MTIEVQLPDGSKKKFASGTTVLDVAKSIGAGLAKAAFAGRIDGKMVDLRTPLKESCALEIVTNKDPASGEVIRHSAEHVMADAVKQLWPEAQIDVGRTDHAEKFQYDFKMNRPFTPEDLEKIEKKMNEILKKKSLFTREVLDRKAAAGHPHGESVGIVIATVPFFAHRRPTKFAAPNDQRFVQQSALLEVVE